MSMSSIHRLVYAHLDWHRDFWSCLERGDTLDPEALGRDNACAVGEWIHGEGSRHAGLPQFEALKQAHAEYHSCIAQAVVLANQGRRAEALDRLHADGPCGGLSHDLVLKCGDLSEALKKA